MPIESETLQGRFSFAGMVDDLAQVLRSMNNPVASAARKFANELPDFYQSLAERIESSKGMSLADMFERDAQRYSHNEDGEFEQTPRGVLSRHWADRYLDSGGSLAQTFAGTLPREDVALIGMGQEAGVGALPATLRDLSRISTLIRKAKGIFVGATMMGALATLVVVGAMILTPTVTVPRLRESFIMPDEYLPGVATKLYAFSGFLESYLFLLLILVCSAVYMVVWSLPNYTGNGRKKLDRYLIWRLYRDMQGALFLAVLSTMVRKRGNVTDNLSNALGKMVEGSSPWRSWHINHMISNIENLDAVGADNSTAIAMAMNTGMIDKESFYFFMDVQEGQGLSVALEKVGARVEGPTLITVEKQAKAVSRFMLAIGLGTMVVWAGTHIFAAKALIEGMKSFLSS
jgi:hypothetical protein